MKFFFFFKKIEWPPEEFFLNGSTISLPPYIPDLLNTPNFPKHIAHLRRLFSGECPFLNSNNPFHSCRISLSSLRAIRKTRIGILAPGHTPILCGLSYWVLIEFCPILNSSPVNEGGLPHSPGEKARPSEVKQCAKSHTAMKS